MVTLEDVSTVSTVTWMEGREKDLMPRSRLLSCSMRLFSAPASVSPRSTTVPVTEAVSSVSEEQQLSSSSWSRGVTRGHTAIGESATGDRLSSSTCTIMVISVHYNDDDD